MMTGVASPHWTKDRHYLAEVWHIKDVWPLINRKLPPTIENMLWTMATGRENYASYILCRCIVLQLPFTSYSSLA